MRFSINHLKKKLHWSFQRKFHNFTVCLSNLKFDIKNLFKINDLIIINSWIDFRNGKIIHRNLGDDLNYYIFKELTNAPIRFYHSTFLSIIKRTNYICIGSVISHGNSRSIIWGGGLISNNSSIHKPQKVLAVRGPRTRQRLIQAGIECPKVYGDPALLLPYIYNPSTSSESNTLNKIGLIFNAADETQGSIYANSHNCFFTKISMTKYTKWQHVVDEIKECNLILSSSLHGLILADAYEIPNIWVSFNNNNNIIGGDFKFLDYLESVNRHQTKPVSLEIIIEEGIDKYLNLIEKPNINLKPLINNCPFKINITQRQTNDPQKDTLLLV